MANATPAPLNAKTPRPSATLRVFGVIVGATLAALGYSILRQQPWLALLVSVLVVATYTYIGWALSKQSETALWRRMLMLSIAPLAILGGIIGAVAFLIIIGTVTPYFMFTGLLRERR